MRNAHLMVYGSSYDRGLEHLLKMWPKVKEEVPDAQLRVFYGWNLFDKVYHDNPERQEWKRKVNELMSQPGITHLGRISHEAVRKEMENAAIWAYPTHFGEISCITAMKAQAWGAIPVVINYAALTETVQYGIKVDGDIYDPEVRDLYVKSLTSLLKDEKQQEFIRPKMMEWAKKFSWENVARQWNEEFKSEMSLDRQVEDLLENNQALKAWELVKDTDWPRKDRLWLRVKHAFNPEDYKKYYGEDLKETPMPEDLAFQVDQTHPRFKWLVKRIQELSPKTLVDLGCADGYLCLTLAGKGVRCTGVNLFKPSVDLANERSKKFSVPAEFVCEDLMDHKGKYDVVVMAEVIEHLPDAKKAIDHALTLGRSGGTLFLTTPSPEHVGILQHKTEEHGTWDDGLPSGHLRIFTKEELIEMVKGHEIIYFGLDAEGCYLLEVKI